MTTTYSVEINVEGLSREAFEAYSSADVPAGVVCHGVGQAGGYDRWDVTAESEDAARAVVEAACRGYDVEIVSVRPS
jgi:hypothetical protein